MKNNLPTQPYKGARDFYPEDKRFQKYLFAKLRETAESFGYEEYDAPILEPLEIYLAKTGDEIVNEQTYSFTDRGGRAVAIRPEMTPTVSRMVAARRQQLIYPLRWYSIPNLWRYERPQRGRLREHWQLNVDIFGIADASAESEIIEVADQIFQSVGASRDMYEVRINSRVLMNYVLETYLRLDQPSAHAVAKLIDRIHKMSRQDFLGKLDEILSEQAKQQGVSERLLDVLEAKSLQDLPSEFKTIPSVSTLAEMIQTLRSRFIDNVRFDVTLMRGFDYYTDIVFEIFDTHPENNRSMLGGGRYDGLIGLFGVAPLPTVGFGLGDATLANFVQLHNLMPELVVETQVYIVNAGVNSQEIAQVARQLRSNKIKVAVDLTQKKIGDQLKIAAKKGISFALIIGQNELAAQRFNLKDLSSGKETPLTIDQITARVSVGPGSKK